MSVVKIAFIINPHAGRKHSRDIAKLLSRYLDTKSYLPVFYSTQYPKHAKELTNQAAGEGCKIVVAVGGDGTVNEVASAAIKLEITMGIVPAGSGNGLARHLKIPLSVKKSMQIINQNSTMLIDAGRINDAWFFCTCGIGFDAKVGYKFSKINERGLFGYIKTIVQEFNKYNIKRYNFSIDGAKYKRKAFLITVANASQYGNNAYIAPRADISDGLLDICIVNPFPRWKVIFLILRLMRGSIIHSEYYEYIRAKSIQFKRPKKKYIVHYDGEPIKIKREKIIVEIVPNILKVIVPEKNLKQKLKR